MSSDRPDPQEFLEMAQRMLRGLFDQPRGGDDPWARATERGSAPWERHREPSPGERRENLTFALATRAVEALEDLALNVAAIRQRLERSAQDDRPGEDGATRDDTPPA
ncbi:hypothetical protein SAMN04488107_0003 [Geodermatophilus saharensis]|uniref:Uncharacterized protein n=1 Tax=Geodermatophilus saharensis TaxID=1137994 RepID=A0A238ZEQ0_9ACTN|nr:hypothetical protein [Geodermatophilus saharensis]SNR81552.1 hypothetical protein SAMN04488107_0003 [Geodermatophilus saharensis]